MTHICNGDNVFHKSGWKETENFRGSIKKDNESEKNEKIDGKDVMRLIKA